MLKFVMLFALSVLFFMVIVAEIIIPIWRGTKMFPSFRRGDLKQALIEANEELDTFALQEKVNKRQEEVKAVQSRLQGSVQETIPVPKAKTRKK